MWQCARFQFDTNRPLIMGVLNVTPDSFSDGARFCGVEDACDYGRLLVEQGAAIIDVGGESTRPLAAEIQVEEELARVLPVVSQLAGEGLVVSIDTRHAKVARACVEAGAAIINDVSGFSDPAMVEVALACGAGLIVMHMQGQPQDMQERPAYEDVVREVSTWLLERAYMLEAAGVAHERICIDPGPGFGKDFEHNLALLEATPVLAALGYPLVAAWSRKAFIGQLSGVSEPSERLLGSVAVAAYAASAGASILRVHDVAATVETLKVHAALRLDRKMRRVFVAMGSNVGNSAATLGAAAERLAALPGVTLLRMSSLYASEPAYLEDQELFCNAVAEVQTQLEPLELLKALQAVEARFGRIRGEANGPRTLDLDIVDYEGVTNDEPELMLPHPLALERDFVVTPLLEIAPGLVLADGSPVTREAVTVGKVVACLDAESLKDASEESASPASQERTGLLSLCATPIGNLGDITQRVIEALKDADVVLAEDTRVARKLLSHLSIRTTVERCDENTIRQRAGQIIERIQQGSHIAFIADAGTPCISDPGAVLVAAAQEAGCAIQVLPGASAVLAALVASGFPAHSFYFGGFLPRKKPQIAAALKALEQLDAPLVFFESPHRAAASLAVIAELFPNRELAFARELTKLHEEVLRAPAPQLTEQIATRVAGTSGATRSAGAQPLKGELVVVIGPPSKSAEKRIHVDRYNSKNSLRSKQ